MVRREGFEPPTLGFEAWAKVQEIQIVTRFQAGMNGNAGTEWSQATARRTDVLGEAETG